MEDIKITKPNSEKEDLRNTYSKRIAIANSIYQKYVDERKDKLEIAVAETMNYLSDLCDSCYDNEPNSLSRLKLLLLNGYNRLLPVLYAVDRDAFDMLMEEIKEIKER